MNLTTDRAQGVAIVRDFGPACIETVRRAQRVEPAARRSDVQRVRVDRGRSELLRLDLGAPIRGGELPLERQPILAGISQVQDRERHHEVAEWLRDMRTAAGLDPERCIFFRQGDVQEHTELTWLLNSVTISSTRSFSPINRARLESMIKENGSLPSNKNFNRLFHPSRNSSRA